MSPFKENYLLTSLNRICPVKSLSFHITLLDKSTSGAAPKRPELQIVPPLQHPNIILISNSHSPFPSGFWPKRSYSMEATVTH